MKKKEKRRRRERMGGVLWSRRREEGKEEKENVVVFWKKKKRRGKRGATVVQHVVAIIATPCTAISLYFPLLCYCCHHKSLPLDQLHLPYHRDKYVAVGLVCYHASNKHQARSCMGPSIIMQTLRLPLSLSLLSFCSVAYTPMDLIFLSIQHTHHFPLVMHKHKSL